MTIGDGLMYFGQDICLHLPMHCEGSHIAPPLELEWRHACDVLMSISIRGKALLSRLKALLTLQRFNHNLTKGGRQAQVYADIGSDSVFEQGQIDFSNWRKVDSRTLGITRSMIPEPSWIVLKILQSKGFEAYLVGGCVRDLLLNKIPKDFDVITTATLQKIQKQFHRSEIVGSRFPICLVHVKGSVIEVSSFETVARHAEGKKEFAVSQIPRGCDKLDLVRWQNCMRRDFTINSLFFNPFVNKIYDYANGMMDLRSLKLQTLMPAQLSFKEDCARILRGLRIAARLGLSFSKETESAIHKLSSSIKSLSKCRLMMELNYMLSYGAAEPSLCLLWRFNLLEILLPFHAAYLDQQASKYSQSSMMLMKLFFNLDRLITCDRPSDSSLWVGLLAFHLALVNNPQNPLVVLAFASVLYHGKWKEGVKFARQHAQASISFTPEISEAHDFISDDELVERITQLVLLVHDSIDVLTKANSLRKTMASFPDFPCSGLVFVSKKMGSNVAQLFNVLVHNVESLKKGRMSFEINYDLLGKGNLCETRFVLGKIILDTMGCGIVRGSEVIEKENDHMHTIDAEHKVEVFEGNFHTLSDLVKHHAVRKDGEKCYILPSNSELQEESAKKQKSIGKSSNLLEQRITEKHKVIVNKKPEKILEQQDLVENKKCLEVAKNHQKVVSNENGCIAQDYASMKQERVASTRSPQEEKIIMQENLLKKENCQLHKEDITKMKEVLETGKYQDKAEKHLKVVERLEQATGHISKGGMNKKQQKSVEKLNLFQEEMVDDTECHLHLHKVVRESDEKHKQQLIKGKGRRQPLSSLFK